MSTEDIKYRVIIKPSWTFKRRANGGYECDVLYPYAIQVLKKGWFKWYWETIPDLRAKTAETAQKLIDDLK